MFVLGVIEDRDPAAPRVPKRQDPSTESEDLGRLRNIRKLCHGLFHHIIRVLKVLK
jgi:hypothetical protein